MRQTIVMLCLAMILLPAHVKRVIDGDTFILFHVGVPAEERVRLLGVDTPESRELTGAEATLFTRTWLAQGSAILTTCKRDSFGRLLGTVTRGATDLGQDLVKAGLATVTIR